MRWSFAGWVGLCLTTGCTNFVGAESDGAASGPGSTDTTSASAGTDSAGTAMTDGATSTTSPSGPSTSPSTTDPTDPSAPTDPTSSETSPETTDGSDTTSTTSESTGVPASCDNAEQDGNETDVDCGGSCEACDVGDGCEAGTDCTTGFCDLSSSCGLQDPLVWLDALDPDTLFNDNMCSNSPPTDGQQIYCWENKGSTGGFFTDDGSQPLYREPTDGVELDNDNMISDANVFGGALGDVTVFVVQREVQSSNSFDFNLNHPNENGNRYSSHIPWGNSSRSVVFDIGGSGGGARISTPVDVIAVDETHVFTFVNSAEEDQRLLRIDGVEEASGAGALTATAGLVSIGNGSRAVMHEFRVYSPSPTPLQRRVIEGQLACRWDLRDQLAATHPFFHADGAAQAGCPPAL